MENITNLQNLATLGKKTSAVDHDTEVSNLELENNDDFLLEDGGFILLEG